MKTCQTEPVKFFSLPGDLAPALGAIAFFGLVAAKEISTGALPFYAALFFTGIFCFVQARLPKPESFLYFLAAMIPFSQQLSHDSGLLPDPLVLSISFLGSAWLFSWIQRSQALSKNLPMEFDNAVHQLPGGDFDGRSPEKFRSLHHAGISRFARDDKNQSNAFDISDLFLFVFLILGAVSAVHGKMTDGNESQNIYEFLIRWILPAALYKTVFSLIRTKPAFQNLAWTMVAASAMSALVVIYQCYNVGETGDLEGARVGGIANDPNVMAAFLNFCMFLPLAFVLRYAGKKPLYLLMGIPFLVMLRALLATYSRGGYAAFALGLFVTLAAFKKRWLIPFALAGAVMILFPSILPSSMRERMAQTFEKPAYSTNDLYGSIDKSNRDRIEVWRGGLKMIGDHPLWGVGYGQFYNQIRFYWPAAVPFDAHNTFILIAAEMGLPALFVFILFLGTFTWRLFSVLRFTRDPLTGSIALGTLAGFSTFLFNYFIVIRMDHPETASYFWILAGMIMRLWRLETGNCQTESRMGPIQTKNEPPPLSHFERSERSC